MSGDSSKKNDSASGLGSRVSSLESRISDADSNATFTGYIDLHCHYLPGIDDGVDSLEEGVELCRGLRELGYAKVIATPHIRTAMFENNKAVIESAFQHFRTETSTLEGMPALGLGAEHFFDDAVWQLLEKNEAVLYPGGHALLIEFSNQSIPLHVENRFFDLKLKQIHPVLAHPERYDAIVADINALASLVRYGALPLLDVMSLVGNYGRSTQRTAEALLNAGLYFAACSDSHKARHLERVSQAIERLKQLVGEESAELLLAERPRQVLSGEIRFEVE